MKVSIKNLSKKSRSKKYMNELKQYAREISFELGTALDIKEIKLTYKDHWNGYYPKGKPLGGFIKLYKNKIVQIDFVGHWDLNQHSRKRAIIHELTHVSQILEGRLQINKACNDLKWKGNPYPKWKLFRNKEYEEKSTIKEKNKYAGKLFPWEREVEKNISRYLF